MARTFIASMWHTTSVGDVRDGKFWSRDDIIGLIIYCTCLSSNKITCYLGLLAFIPCHQKLQSNAAITKTELFSNLRTHPVQVGSPCLANWKTWDVETNGVEGTLLQLRLHAVTLSSLPEATTSLTAYRYDCDC